jgi:PAS domain S-box-containing protein
MLMNSKIQDLLPETHLQEQEQFLRTVYDGVEHLIFVINIEEDGDIRWMGWNIAAERATGLSSDFVQGKTPEEWAGTEEGSAIRQKVRHCLSTETTFTYEECLTFNGKPTWWLTTLNPLKDAAGKIYRIVGTTFGITERKIAEIAVHQKSQELEQALQELQQAQLKMVQGEKMSALGNLVAGVAHEINNPIGCIVGNVSAVRDSIYDLFNVIDLYQQKFPQPGAEIEEELESIDLNYLREDLPKLVKAMKDGGDRIKSISHSLRNFSRSDTDAKQSFNLHEGIDSTVMILRHRLKANEKRPEIEVITEYGDIPMITCFPGQLNQVFMNILANAIDAIDESIGERSFAEIKAQPNQIKIRTTVENNQVQITIADNGKGMPEEIRAKIFDNLFTTKEVGKGTGLGLAIAQQIIVEKHGGAIEVSSELGKGTEFVIYLPIKA